MKNSFNIVGMPEKCRVPGCGHEADYAVTFYDVYPYSEVTVFHQPHESCPFICQEHLDANEQGAEPDIDDVQDDRERKMLRRYRGTIRYPYTKSQGQGFCIYRPLK